MAQPVIPSPREVREARKSRPRNRNPSLKPNRNPSPRAKKGEGAKRRKHHPKRSASKKIPLVSLVS